MSKLNYQLFLKFKKFLGADVWTLFILSIVIGFCWFLIEWSFIFVLQGFLKSLGILKMADAALPDWYPTDSVYCILLLMTFGIFRSSILGMKLYIAGLTNQTYSAQKRKKILQMGLSRISKRDTAEVLTLFTENVHQSGHVLEQLIILIINITTISLLFLLGLKLAPLQFVISIVLFGAATLPLKLFTKQLNNSSLGIADEMAHINRTLILGLRNKFLIHLYGMYEKEVSKGIANITKYKQHFQKYYKVLAFKSMYPSSVGVMIIGLITFLNIKYFGTPGVQLIGLFYLFIRFANSVSEIQTSLSDVHFYKHSFKKLWLIESELNNSGEIKTNDSLASKDTLPRPIDITLQNVSFSYNEVSHVFHDINECFLTGDCVLIRGESGSGKSTLISVILGLLPSTSGKITYNGKNLTDISGELQNSLGYVGPEPYLLSGSVKENLLYGYNHQTQPTDDELWKALEFAQLDKDIRLMPKKLEQPLSENTELSTGQKQRLSIARALIRKPRILILDEATANLDKDTEGKIKSCIYKIKSETLIFIISHKDSFNDICTKIIDVKKMNRRNVDVSLEH